MSGSGQGKKTYKWGQRVGKGVGALAFAALVACGNAEGEGMSPTLAKGAMGLGAGSTSLLPDLAALEVKAACDPITQAVTLSARIQNLGAVPTTQNVPVGFYLDNPLTGGALLGGNVEVGVLHAGAEAEVHLPLPSGTAGPAEVWAVVDDLGFGQGIELELNEGNNSVSAQVDLSCASDIKVRLGDYNLFLLGDYNLGTDVEGKVAAGGNISMVNFAVGARLPESDTSQVLVAGGNLNLSRGAVYGDAWYGGSYSAGTSVTHVRGSASQGKPIDFGARFAQLRGLSYQLDGLEANGSVTLEPWGGVMLRGTAPDVNVFDLDASVFGNAKLLSIDAPAGSLAVLNIRGASASFSGFGHEFRGGIDQTGVLFNLVDATSITAGGFGFWGTVLAPYAHVQFSNGSFDGGLFAVSLTGNAEGHINPLRDFTIRR